VTRARLGLIVNPIAGIGGRVGLKGSDDPDLVRRARSLGGQPVAPDRAVATLRFLAGCPDVDLVTVAGPMGGEAAVAAGLRFEALPHVAGRPSTADDTRIAARLAADAGVDLLLFVGGDGTAADLLGLDLPILGVPAGVKMYSAVFATGPRAATVVAGAFLGQRPEQRWTEPREVLDVDEAAMRRDERAVRLLGVLQVPRATGGLQSLKTTGLADERIALASLAAAVTARLKTGHLVILGPGTTTAAIAVQLGVAHTLLGVDVAEILPDGTAHSIALDASEEILLEAVAGRPATIVLSPTGGQGFLLGRGNQQVSARVLAAVGLERLLVAATPSKLAALAGRPLLVDTGDEAIDAALAGYRRVVTGPGSESVVAVAPA